MEAHDQILHGLLDMGQMLLLCGAEKIGRAHV